MKTFRLFLSLVLLLSAIGMAPVFAISEGGNCSSAKFGNNLVMSNGKIHGGAFGPNKNYEGPLYLCDGGTWVFWKMAEPANQSSTKTVNVKPGQACNKLGRVVESTNYGSLACAYVRVGKLRALIWVRN